MRHVRQISGATLWIGLASASLGVAEATCPKEVTVAELAQHVTAADVAFTNLDEDRFHSARAAAAWALPCLNEALEGGHAAGMHRVEALGGFLTRDHVMTLGSFRAMLASAPGYQLPDSLAPEGHPMRMLFEVAEGMAKVPGAPLAVPRKGELLIDGEAATEVPVDRPYIFQHVGEAGAVFRTALVQPGLSPPEYAAQAVREGHLAVHIPLALTAGASAVASGALYFLADQQAATFWDPATPQTDLAIIRGRTNTLGWLSVGTGALAVGAGAAAVVVGSW